MVMRVIMITTKSYIEGKTSKHPYVYGYLQLQRGIRVITQKIPKRKSALLFPLQINRKRIIYNTSFIQWWLG